MEEAMIGAVRVVHIASAISLAGGGFLYTLVIAPTLAKRFPGPKIGEFMNALGPAMGRYFSLLAYVVFLSGATLLASIWGWRHVFDILFGGGLYGSILLAGIAAFLVGLAIAESVIMPTGRRLVSPDTPPSSLPRLQRRQAIAFVVVSALDFVALAMMALAVNART
ncbi:MAG TPA: hypothetical protein VFH78_05455 [Candidatus Thermoplasmatota archaeon]|nr:hypothetical protein [Candidatus Thermoplasmatota archaeon]